MSARSGSAGGFQPSVICPIPAFATRPVTWPGGVPSGEVVNDHTLLVLPGPVSALPAWSRTVPSSIS